jgi:hypothetical protein
MYPSVVKQLARDLPELLAFFRFPRHLWRKLRTTKIINPKRGAAGPEPLQIPSLRTSSL